MSEPIILITGAGGMLAQALDTAMRAQGWNVIGMARSELDVTNASAVRAAILDVRPDIVIQGAAYTKVDEAESREDLAFGVNAAGATNVARACSEIGTRFVYPSTDYVFDGSSRTPYRPGAPPHPLNAYGRSKLAGEAAARTTRDHLIVRTCWLYGAGGSNFVRTIARRLERGERVRVVTDQYGAPTWTRDLAHMIVALLAARAPGGIYHATNAGSTTWYELAGEVASLLGMHVEIEPCTTSQYPTPARRPAWSVLDCTDTYRFTGPARDWRSALADAVRTGEFR
ncbi:MAG: dTDP-4-dehydrorhamnose reductase [Gemmatimonadota bacterium]